jgi:hypothetical protein
VTQETAAIEAHAASSSRPTARTCNAEGGRFLRSPGGPMPRWPQGVVARLSCAVSTPPHSRLALRPAQHRRECPGSVSRPATSGSTCSSSTRCCLRCRPGPSWRSFARRGVGDHVSRDPAGRTRGAIARVGTLMDSRSMRVAARLPHNAVDRGGPAPTEPSPTARAAARASRRVRGERPLPTESR